MYPQNKKPVICVSGAAEMSSCCGIAPVMAKNLGKAIAEAGCILTTGATTGFPQWANVGAKEVDGYTIGVSPAATEEEHMVSYKLPVDHMDLIFYTGFGFPGRDLLLVRASEGVVFGCGRIGTIHEFTIAFEEEKPIGILVEDCWKTDEVIQTIIKNGNRPHDHVIFEKDPVKLINKIKEMIFKKRELNLQKSKLWN